MEQAVEKLRPMRIQNWTFSFFQSSHNREEERLKASCGNITSRTMIKTIRKYFQRRRERSWADRYISDSYLEYYTDLRLSVSHLTDSKMSLLFKHLAGVCSLEALNLSYNHIGLNGIQNMVPFLKSNQSLTKLRIGNNDEINTKCFRLLILSLHHGGSIEYLWVDSCSIDDISALKKYFLPNLRFLALDYNNVRNLSSLEKYKHLDSLRLRGNAIGKVGCESLATMLQDQSTRLRILDLSYNNTIGEEAAEILAHSLKYNTTLEDLSLINCNNIKERGLRAFLTILVDMSSIESTYNSNHTLSMLRLPLCFHPKSNRVIHHIGSALVLKLTRGKSYHDIGRAKVIEYQLKSQPKIDLCRLQGIDCPSSNLFVEIETVLLPDMLAALASNNFGHSDLYRMVCTRAPDLASLVSKPSMS